LPLTRFFAIGFADNNNGVAGRVSKMSKQTLLDCWKMFRREHDVSVDRLIRDPELSRKFLESVLSVIPEAKESDILLSLLTMRKQKKLSR